MPLVRPHLAAGLLLGLTRASGEVDITMMLGGNISDRTNTLSLEIFNAVSRAEFDAATALCLPPTIFTFVVFCLLEIIQKRAVKLFRKSYSKLLDVFSDFFPHFTRVRAAFSKVGCIQLKPLEGQ